MGAIYISNYAFDPKLHFIDVSMLGFCYSHKIILFGQKINIMHHIIFLRSVYFHINIHIHK